MSGRGMETLSDQASRMVAELTALRERVAELEDQVLSSEMLLDFRIAAGILLDPQQAARIDLLEQAQVVARNQLATLDELERVRFVLAGDGEP
jgi:CHAD domain-containing protein